MCLIPPSTYVVTKIEDTEHLLLHSPLFQIPRQKIRQTIARQNINMDDINVHVMLYGDERYSLLANKNIFSSVYS